MSAENSKSSIKPNHMYRSGVGIMLINRDKHIFVGKRIDNNSDSWQMPQGGIDAGEEEDFAMFRELREETGIVESKVEILKKSNGYFYYNLPYKLQKKFWGGKYLGQRQRWYLLKFNGDEKDINIKTIEPEFSDWKWSSKQEITKLIVRFKRELYEEIIREFENSL